MPVDDCRREEILQLYAKIANDVGQRSPSIAEFEGEGLTRNTIRHSFGTRSALDEEARETFPDCFSDIYVGHEKPYTPTSSRVVITSAVIGCKAHEGFMGALQTYCEHNSAELLIVPVADPAANVSPNAAGTLDKTIYDVADAIITDDTEICPALTILAIQLSAKQINPLTGLDRFGDRGGSCIIGSPKMLMKMVASDSVYPHALMTTGACTVPNYKSSQHRSKRTAYLADADHSIAALVVDIGGDGKFHFRQLVAGPDGAFLDEGWEYAADATHIEFTGFDTIIAGDIHVGSTCEKSWDFLLTAPEQYGCKTIFVHDIFDGAFGAHHYDGRPGAKGKVDRPSLQAEVLSVIDALAKLSDVYDSVVVVRSNHDEWLEKRIASGKWVDDYTNYKLWSELNHFWTNENKEPLEYACRKYYDLPKVTFLKRDESFRAHGVECGAHGDLGTNGTRGGLASSEKAYGSSVTGHTHTPAILRNAWQVGTSSVLRKGYNTGPSSWFNSHILLGSWGRRQIINLLPEKDIKQ